MSEKRWLMYRWRLIASLSLYVQAGPQACPPEGRNRPQSMRITVVFPAPLAPRKPKISPWATSMLTWSTATKRPKRRLNS